MIATKRWHPCGDTCHYSRWMPLSANASGRSTLKLLHVCGPWCPRDDDGGPIRLGRPDPYDRTPVPCRECGGWMRAGQRHYCRRAA